MAKPPPQNPPKPTTTATTTVYNALLEQQIKTSFIFPHIWERLLLMIQIYFNVSL